MQQQAIIEHTDQNLRTGRSFKQVVRLRKSCRGFLSEHVSDELITSVLEDAQQAPSNCNTQPWSTHIVSGIKLQELSAAILTAHNAQHYTPDFSFDTDHFYGSYAARAKVQGKAYYEGLGVAKGDQVGRKAAADQNLSFFNAPHAAFLFMPSFGDNVRVAGDIGMYGQTFLLSLTDHGLAGIPQTYLGSFAGTIREALGISDEFKLLFGISFGYADPDAPGNSIKLGRDAISSSVTFHQ
jgi:nitroreductase